MKRSRLGIIKDILEVSSKKGGARKTTIRYIVGTFDQFNRYIPVLEEKGFIYRKGNDRNTSYITSKKGRELLKQCENIDNLKTNKNNLIS